MHGRLQILPLIILAILLGLTLYGYYAFVGVSENFSTSFTTVFNGFVWGMLILSSISLFVIFGGGNRLSKAIRNFFFAFVFIDLFSLLMLDIFVLLDDFRRIAMLIVQGDASHAVIMIQIGVVTAFIPPVLFGLGMLIGPYRYKVIKTSIKLPNLPKAFDGLRIVQISDIHAGSFYNKKAVKRGIDLILEQKADVIFFTGDLVNDDASEMDNYSDIFSKLNAPLGVYSILGNHDYGDYVQWPSKEAKEQNLKSLKDVHANMGWRLLLNEHVYLEKENEKIALIGIENWGKGFHQVGDMEKAYANCIADTKLLLSHDPTHWDEQVTKSYKDVDITFSGHTHGAQMGFEIGKYKWSPIKLRYKKWAGLYKHNSQHLYINRGFGFLGYPGRLGIWPEVSVITLEKS